jgi:hypothetical protein
LSVKTCALKGLSTQAQQYDHQAVINAMRQEVDKWRALPNSTDWRVTPETARLLHHWRHHEFSGVRPFFCQLEAVETAIWLTEVAPQLGKTGKTFIDHLERANQDANSGLARLALKLATGAGKTTVMAMLIAWQSAQENQSFAKSPRSQAANSTTILRISCGQSSPTYPQPPLDNFCTSHLTPCGRNLDKSAVLPGRSKVVPGSLPLSADASQGYRFRSPLIRKRRFKLSTTRRGAC